MSQISIIIPIYNAEKYLPKCLDSIINQTFKDIEIICVNDGSTDDSLNILNDYTAKDCRIKVFSQANAGPAKARNVGLTNSQSEFIMFCDADDTYEPDMCKIMLDTITANQTDCAMCNSNIISQNDRTYSDVYFNPPLKGLINKKLHKINVVLWNKIFRKSIIDKYNITFPDGFLHDDDCFWYKYALCSRNIYITTDKLYNYVIHSNSIIDNYNNHKQANYFDRFYITKNLLEFAKKHQFFDQNKKALNTIYLGELNSISEFADLSLIASEIQAVNAEYGFNTIFTQDNHIVNYSNLFSMRLKYYLYQILANLSFGKLRQRLDNRRKKYKELLKNIKF